MRTGWARIYRQIEDDNLWLKEPFTRGQAWVDLIIFANHKDNIIWIQGIEIKIKRGEIAWSELTMAKRWKWSRGKIRRFLKWLRSDGKTVQRVVQRKTTILTLLNYDRWQTDEPKIVQLTVQPTDNRRYTNKNDKNVKNDKKEEKKLNPLLIGRGQGMAFLKEFPGLTNIELREQAKKCNNYMAMSSTNYSNPGLFLRGWLRNYMVEKRKKEADIKVLENLPKMSEEERLKSLEKIKEIKSKFRMKEV